MESGEVKGGTGFQPVVLGILPKTLRCSVRAALSIVREIFVRANFGAEAEINRLEACSTRTLAGFFGGLGGLFFLNPGTHQGKPVNRQENKWDKGQAKQEISDQDERPSSEMDIGGIPQNLTFGKNLEIGHQVVVRAYRMAAVPAEPGIGWLRGGTVQASFRGILKLLLIDLGVPRIRPDGRLAHPDDEPPKCDHRQSGKAVSGNNHVWITGSEHVDWENVPLWRPGVKRRPESLSMATVYSVNEAGKSWSKAHWA
jgi:hypothetical protein